VRKLVLCVVLALTSPLDVLPGDRANFNLERDDLVNPFFLLGLA
jgi:hypothetical protein